MKSESSETVFLKSKRNTKFLLSNAVLFSIVFYLVWLEFQFTELNYTHLFLCIWGLFYFGLYPFLVIMYEKKNIGLAITNEGYFDKSSGDLILWCDVANISISKNILFKNYILIDIISQPNKPPRSNRLMKLSKIMNTILLGAPVFINTGILDVNKYELVELMLMKKNQ